MTQLFVDMDGVLADFDAGYEQRFGIRSSKEADNVDWKLVRDTPNFYRDLPPMPGFDRFWMRLKVFNPIIITGVPRSIPEAAPNKLAWVRKHIGALQPVICCASKDKSLYMHNPGDILIDDWEKYRQVWIDRGGRWITHVSNEQSIAELNAAYWR